MPRQYIYKLTHVTGTMRGKLHAGQFIVAREHDKNGYTWTVMSLKTGKVTGRFTGKFIAPYTPSLLAELHSTREG